MLFFIHADSENKYFFPITCTVELPLRLQRGSVSLSHPHPHTNNSTFTHLSVPILSSKQNSSFFSSPPLGPEAVCSVAWMWSHTVCQQEHTEPQHTGETQRRNHVTSAVSLKHTHTRKAKLGFSHSSFCTVGLLGTGEFFQGLDQRCSKNHTKLLRCGKTSKASYRAVNGL